MAQGYGLPFWVDDFLRSSNVHFITGAHCDEDLILVPRKYHSKQITEVNLRQVYIAETKGFLTANFLEMGARNFKNEDDFKENVHLGIIRKRICEFEFLAKI
jgi:hypothetical protein